ncbi:amino acid transporter [Curtobacterium sp. Leaf261]|nr:amino acid transporter [Curtobacterium sp. Leaf261]
MLGLGTGLGLIVAIGSQNAFLLRLGITGRPRVVGAAVLVCAASDAVLIVAGVLGVGVVVERFPVALVLVRIVGAGFLVTYGVLAARRALRPSGDALEPGPGAGPATLGMRRALVTMLALTWLNPHVYLDTLVFLGSVGNQQGEAERWWWVAGAVLASCVWFAGLGFGARLLRPVFARPVAWRVLDGCIAVVMVALGVRIALGA